MKCNNCGHTEVGAYKEVRSLIAEMGITKEAIKNQIDQTIDSLVRATLSEKIETYIANEVARLVQRHTNYTEIQRLVKKALIQKINDELLQELNFSINIEKKEE